MPEALARRIADLPALTAAPDIVLIADRTRKPMAEVAATYFAAQAFFRLDRIVSAARAIAVSDYFDRLALDRALDSIGDAERRLTAAMIATGAPGAAAVEAWVAPRKAEVERIRAGDPRDRGLRAHAVEARGGGEPAGRSGEGVMLSSPASGRRDTMLNAGNAACR